MSLGGRKVYIHDKSLIINYNSIYVIYIVEIKSYLRLVNISLRFDEDLYSFISI